MQSLTIDLPMNKYVEAQIAAGGHRSASDYVGQLILADEKRKAEQRLETFLMVGLQSQNQR